MREDESNWFSKWQEELPSPEELMPISQSLITADLASAFDIRAPPLTTAFHHHHQSASSPQLFGGGNNHNYGVELQLHQQSSSTPQPPHNSSEFDSSSAELCGGGGSGGGGGGGGGADEPARTLKRPRLVWTPQLHKRFVDAVAHLGIKNAVPKTIMQLMSVDGLTRENVASHLQKYRLYLKRMQSINNGGGGGGHGGGNGPGSDDDHLFASSPVPAHFLHQVASGTNTGPVPIAGGGIRPNSDQFMQYMPAASLHHQHITRIQTQAQAQTQAHYDQHRQMVGHFGLAHQNNGQFDHPYLSRQAQLGPNRNGMESSTPNHNRKVLTLFPTADE